MRTTRSSTRFRVVVVLFGVSQIGISALPPVRPEELQPGPGGGIGPDAALVTILEGPSLRLMFSQREAQLVQVESRGFEGSMASESGARAGWLNGAPTLAVRNEARDMAEQASLVGFQRAEGSVKASYRLRELAIDLAEEWSVTPSGIAWDLTFDGKAERAGHEVTIELPILSSDRQVFTPSERGVISLALRPTYEPPAYATLGWGQNRYYVLPLVSILEPRRDAGLTIALPPDGNIPHLQISWTDARTLRLLLGHRAMGGGSPSRVRLLLYAHAADYRSAIKAYSDDFPRYFRPALPRGKYEGAFWYHHIQDHPDFGEMARQDVRFIWASFWFTHLGEYLPEEMEWNPYTYACWWKLGQKMSDAKIRAFVEEMHRHEIGTFAYFNVTEYGGAGGTEGDAKAAARRLQEDFADALMKREDGQPIPTWEGAMAMNCDPRYSLFPFLQEQIRRHITRIPAIDGFTVDRLDWASLYDYGHSDGLTMLGARRVENMAGPVALGVAEVCRQAHAAGKRVYVNQFYRLEVLRDVDGYCHEYDFVRGLGYLGPYRPIAAWHCQRPYAGDLLQHEAQLKSRLQFGVFPQMIAHSFPISQQAPDPEAADMLELYAPLFSRLRGKEQLLEPHCVDVSGPNEANLYVNGRGHYVIPITSRAAFLSRGGGPETKLRLRLRLPDAAELKWAHLYSADGPPRRLGFVADSTGISSLPVTLEVAVAGHITSSVVVTGRGAEPELDSTHLDAIAQARSRLNSAAPVTFVPADTSSYRKTTPPQAKPEGSGAITELILVVRGEDVGAGGGTFVHLGERSLGELRGSGGRYTATAGLDGLGGGPPQVRLLSGDEGAWFVPESVRLLGRGRGGGAIPLAIWKRTDGFADDSTAAELRLRLSWLEPHEPPLPAVRFLGKDTRTGGAWKAKLGATAAWVARAATPEAKNGFHLQPVQAKHCTWAERTKDERVLAAPEGASGAAPPDSPAKALEGGQGKAAVERASTCWFEDGALLLSIRPPDDKPYRLTIYLLDYDRNGRAMEVSAEGELGDIDVQRVSKDETAQGVYLGWAVAGPIVLEITKVEGFNVVASGVFVDR